MTMIPARRPYTASSLGQDYNRAEIRQQLNLLAQSVPPQSTRTVVADTTAQTTDDLIVCNTSGGNISVTLPVAGQVQFLCVAIINIGAGTVTVVGTVSGSVNPTLAQWHCITVQTDGLAWYRRAAS